MTGQREVSRNLVSYWYDHIELAPELEELLIRMVQEARLEFAAIDLVVDRHGKTWFIDLNPAGQWAWLEMVLELPLSQAIADLLAGIGPRANPAVGAACRHAYLDGRLE